MLTLNTIEPDHHVLCRDGAPIGVLRVDLATATRIVALLNLAAWVEAGDREGSCRIAKIEREDEGGLGARTVVTLDDHGTWRRVVAAWRAGGERGEFPHYKAANRGSGATLDEALADLGVLR